MKTEIKITVRAYPVKIRDERTGEKMDDTIVLDKARLQAAATVGMGDEELIYRLYNRRGYRVLDVGYPIKKDLTVELGQLYRDHVAEEYLAMEECMGPDVVEQEAGACDLE